MALLFVCVCCGVAVLFIFGIQFHIPHAIRVIIQFSNATIERVRRHHIARCNHTTTDGLRLLYVFMHRHIIGTKCAVKCVWFMGFIFDNNLTEFQFDIITYEHTIFTFIIILATDISIGLPNRPPKRNM